MYCYSENPLLTQDKEHLVSTRHHQENSGWSWGHLYNCGRCLQGQSRWTSWPTGTSVCKIFMCHLLNLGTEALITGLGRRADWGIAQKGRTRGFIKGNRFSHTERFCSVSFSPFRTGTQCSETHGVSAVYTPSVTGYQISAGERTLNVAEETAALGSRMTDFNIAVNILLSSLGIKDPQRVTLRAGGGFWACYIGSAEGGSHSCAVGWLLLACQQSQAFGLPQLPVKAGRPVTHCWFCPYQLPPTHECSVLDECIFIALLWFRPQENEVLSSWMSKRDACAQLWEARGCAQPVEHNRHE